MQSIISKSKPKPNPKPKPKTNITNLPDILLILIYSYLPVNVRLYILKNRHSKKVLLRKIEKMTVHQLYKLSFDALHNITYADFEKYKWTRIKIAYVEMYTKKDGTEYPEIYVKEFINIIMFAIKHYTNIYKQSTDTAQIMCYEKRAFKMIADIIRL